MSEKLVIAIDCDDTVVDFINPFLQFTLQCAQAGITAFLIARPWNKNAEKHRNIIPINSLSEVILHFQ